MAKGREKHQARIAAIQFFGKDLARRAGSKCELCGESGTLQIHDLDTEADPSMETLALLCPRCRDLSGGVQGDVRTLRFLTDAVWSEATPVQALARKLIASVDTDWARDTIELF